MTDTALQIAEAFIAHGDAPTWDADPVARDAAVRWHMRGYLDATGRLALPEDCDCPDREALVRPEGLACGTCGKIIAPNDDYEYRAVCRHPLYGKVTGMFGPPELLETEWMGEDIARIVVADRAEWGAWLERRRKPGTPERIS